MKKKKHYYLIVPASDIYMKAKDNDTILFDYAAVGTLFDKYNIPKEYQKVIIKLSFKNNMAKEMATNSVYIIKESLVKAVLNNKTTISLESLDNVIETKLSIYHIDKAKSFYQAIIDNKLAVNYEKAIKEIYRYHYLNKNNNDLRKIKRNEYIH